MHAKKLRVLQRCDENVGTIEMQRKWLIVRRNRRTLVFACFLVRDLGPKKKGIAMSSTAIFKYIRSSSCVFTV